MIPLASATVHVAPPSATVHVAPPPLLISCHITASSLQSNCQPFPNDFLPISHHSISKQLPKTHKRLTTLLNQLNLAEVWFGFKNQGHLNRVYDIIWSSFCQEKGIWGYATLCCTTPEMFNKLLVILNGLRVKSPIGRTAMWFWPLSLYPHILHA